MALGRKHDGMAGGKIALLGLPCDGGAPARGCRAGPAALRAVGLGSLLEALGREVRDFGDLAEPPVLDVALSETLTHRSHRAPAIAAWTRAIHDRAYDLARGDAVPVFLGGDHSISMGTISGIARACREQGRPLVVLWLDAHADFNTPETTPTGNLHGMPVAFLTGDASLRPLLGDRDFAPVPEANFHLFGLRSVDGEERHLLRRSKIACTTMERIVESGVVAPILKLLEQVEAADAHLHVSLDLDVIDPATAPAVGCAVPDGIGIRAAHLIMALLQGSGRVGSVDLVELDPARDQGGKSARLLAELGARLFGPMKPSEDSVILQEIAR
jgi:arginase